MHADDLLLTASTAALPNLIAKIKGEFDLKEVIPIEGPRYLGLEWRRSGRTSMMIRPLQAHSAKILQGQSMQTSRPVSTPGTLSAQEGDDEEKLVPEQASAFRTTTG